ncbi:MAG TPA: VpsR-related response regulator [Stellaceae bacterium]|jgi:DNA-binding response OmpR family regulator|nr:VpsR-related response regulator [Stellaceae bacterium]
MTSVLLIDHRSNPPVLPSLTQHGYTVLIADTLDDAREIVKDRQLELLIATLSFNLNGLSEIAEMAQEREIRVFWIGDSSQPQQQPYSDMPYQIH